MDDKYFIPTTEYLKQLFDTLNNKYFNGLLPETDVLTVDSDDFVGHYEFEYGPCGFLDISVISISIHYQYTEQLLRDVMMHEMLHCYVASVHKWNRFTHHGLWKKRAEEFNSRYGFNITRCVDLDSLPLAPRFKKRNLFQRLFMRKRRDNNE